MNILIIGGTVFVGRAIAEAAIARGHAVTLFNRGSHPDVLPGVTQLRGDRDGDLAALDGRTWDWVVDACGYFPRQVKAIADRRLATRYCFVSTVSVYERTAVGPEEASPMYAPDWTSETVTPQAYGPLKVACEHALTQRYGADALIVRPGIVSGPNDPTDRFTYWAVKMAGAAPVTMPGPADAPVQAIDARDLGFFTVQAMEQNLSGAYNVVGETRTRQAFLAELGDAPVTFADVDEPGLYPFYVPADAAGIFAASAARALEAGLVRRPYAETAADVRAWLAAQPPRPLKAGPPA